MADNILISKSTANSYVSLINNIQLKAGHEYLLFGSFDTDTSIVGAQTVCAFYIDSVYESEKDYFLLFRAYPIHSMASGGGSLAIFAIKAATDMNLIYHLWNYVDSIDYYVNAKVLSILIR